MKFPIFCGHRGAGIWWFRILGYGVVAKRVVEHPLLFSERVLKYGRTIRGWHFSFLRP